MDRSEAIVDGHAIEPLIIVIRGRRVILDADLARLYGVTTKALNQAVRRNRDRFPDDFAFEVTRLEKTELVTNCDQFKNLKHSKVLPIAFTEHGAIMAAGVLSSPRAVRTSVLVVRAFVRMHEMLASNAELMARIGELENRVQDHDRSLRSIVAAIRRLAEPGVRPSRRIGFGADGDGES